METIDRKAKIVTMKIKCFRKEAGAVKKAAAKTNTVYKRIWRSIAAMVVVAFIIAGTAIALYVNHTTTRQIQAQEYAYLADVDTILTHQISSAQQILNMLLTNPFIVQSIYTGNAHWTSEVYWSGQLVVNAVSANQIYNSIYVISGDDIAIKSSRRYQLPSDEAQLIQFMQLDFRKTLIPWQSTVGNRLTHHLMLLSALDTVGTPNNTGGVLINLDLNRLADMAFVHHGGREVCLVLDDQIIASTRADDFFTAAREHPLLSAALGQPDRLHGGRYVFSLQNTAYGYTLYSIQDYGPLMAPVTGGLAVLLSVLSGLILIALLISRRVASHAYVPVKTILIELEEHLPAGQGEGDERLSEVQRVSRSIRRTSEIVSAYRRDADTARLSRMIFNGSAEHARNETLAKMLPSHPGQTAYMILFQAETPESARMASDVLQGYMNEYARFLTLDMPGQRLLSLALVTHPAAEDLILLEQSVAQVLSLMREQGAGRTVIVLQKTTADVDALHDTYIQLDERLRSRVFCAVSAYLPEPTRADIPADVTQQMYKAAIAPDDEAFSQAVSAYLEACRLIPAREAYHQLATLCMRVNGAASHRSLDIADRLDSYRTILNTLFNLPDYPALLAYLQGLHHSAVAALAERKSGENNPLIDRMLAYTEAHFHDPALSAAQVADALGVSVSHLSRQISKALGCGFPDVLQKLRLEHAARQLIAHPGLSIADLAQQCGFSSASYFTTSFKKLYGVTPSNYRLQSESDEKKKP